MLLSWVSSWQPGIQHSLTYLSIQSSTGTVSFLNVFIGFYCCEHQPWLQILCLLFHLSSSNSHTDVHALIHPSANRLFLVSELQLTLVASTCQAFSDTAPAGCCVTELLICTARILHPASTLIWHPSTNRPIILDYLSMHATITHLQTMSVGRCALNWPWLALQRVINSCEHFHK